MFKNLPKYISAAAMVSALLIGKASAQTAYYIDGYHGGVWGHYPDWNTRFMADMLKNHPNWNINIEIEPETWDRVVKVDSAAYLDFKKLFEDQSSKARIEYVSPAFGQSYMYTVQGESIIMHFKYGMRKVRQYFPTAVFSTYSSEEPCFTSALPGILTSYGFKYASLKNPNTCFGGYTRAHGGELVNWIGPDGSSILTSPRYEIEALQPNSTWQTIAWGNAPEYVNAAFKYGIKHPIGMTLQDAGWKGGPFLGSNRGYQPSQYTTWRNYFENVADKASAKDWHVSQEDIQVSLVWGSQVTQRIAQHVRHSENTITSTEKLAAIAGVYSSYQYPAKNFDAAWRTLLLSQHHDCWIVPYNGKPGDTWADKVVNWTGFTNSVCDTVRQSAQASLTRGGGKGWFAVVYNTTGSQRNEVVKLQLPGSLAGKAVSIADLNGQHIASQPTENGQSILFKADVPAAGYITYKLSENITAATQTGGIQKQADGTYILENDEYRIVIDPSKGGAITSLIAKKLDSKQFVDATSGKYFNSLRGNFYRDGGFHATSDTAASVTVLEDGPLEKAVRIDGKIDGTDCSQVIRIREGQPLIDMQLHIDWKHNVGIGETEGTVKWTQYRKPFYDDRNKLLALFPLNLKGQKVYKNAPFDVTASQLDNTFYNSWDSIKNNVILNWVDVTDGAGKYGMSLLTDHTTSYAHGQDFPLGLDVQYSGGGLWGRDYRVDGPTDIHYAIIPHTGTWDKAAVWTQSDNWNEPLMATVSEQSPLGGSKSLLSISKGLELTSIVRDGNSLLLRFFNAEGASAMKSVQFNVDAKSAQLVELDGRVKQTLVLKRVAKGKASAGFYMPRYGFRTVRLIL